MATANSVNDHPHTPVVRGHCSWLRRCQQASNIPGRSFCEAEAKLSLWNCSLGQTIVIKYISVDHGSSDMQSFKVYKQNTQYCSAAYAIGWMGYYIRIPRSCFVLTLGQVFALFSQVTQSQLEKSIIVFITCTLNHLTSALSKGDQPGLVLHGKQP